MGEQMTERLPMRLGGCTLSMAELETSRREVRLADPPLRLQQAGWLELPPPCHGNGNRAGHWRHLGQTAGRGKLDRYNRPTLPVKDVSIYPLGADFRRALGVVR
jgi:hypothetical protein